MSRECSCLSEQGRLSLTTGLHAVWKNQSNDLRSLHSQVAQGRSLRKLCGGIVSVVAITLGAVLVAPPIAEAAAQNASATTDDIARAIVELQSGGKSQADIDAALSSEFGLVKPPGPATSLQAPAAQTDGEASVLSTPANINVFAPSIYRNSSGAYIVSAGYQFIGRSALEDDKGGLGCIGSCNLGGADGFGVAFSRPVTSAQSYTLATSGVGDATSRNYYVISTSRMFVSDGNTYGASFQGQDAARYDGACCLIDYNVYNGTLVYEIRSIGCGVLQAFSKYGHTWSSTAVNSISVGPWSIGIGWSSTDNKWEKASAPSNAVQYC